MLLPAALGFLAGCQGPHSGAEGSPRAPSQRIEMQRMVIGQSTQARPIACNVYGSGDDTTLILAGIHGTERAGTPLVTSLGQYLRDHPELLEGRRVFIIPEANPDGCARQRRENARGVDLNRNFPAANYRGGRGHGSTPLSEPESRALRDLITEYEPDRIISLHQPLTCIDYDGPGEALARAMAAACDLPLKKLGGRDGSLGSWAGDMLGIPIVTVEFTRDASNFQPAEMWERYGKMLLAAIQFGPRRSGAAALSRTFLP